MALSYFNVLHTPSQISKVTNYKKEGGLYNHQLVKSLNHFGLKTKTYANSKWEDLMDRNTQDSVIVLSWMLEGFIGHFSVLEKADEKFIYLSDPHVGKIIKMEKLKFLRLWLDYEAKGTDAWYPEKNSDIQLRWMVVVTK